jgi:hypothetical protein
MTLTTTTTTTDPHCHDGGAMGVSEYRSAQDDTSFYILSWHENGSFTSVLLVFVYFQTLPS